MAYGKDRRLVGPDGERLDFTCENSRYATNIEKGHSHGEAPAGGSVLPEALYDGGSYSLWLEHVVEKKNGHQVYWLMWYEGGRPTIPMSGVFGADDLNHIISKLAGLRVGAA